MIHAMLVSPFKEEHIARFYDIEGYRFSYCARPVPEEFCLYILSEFPSRRNRFISPITIGTV